MGCGELVCGTDLLSSAVPCLALFCVPFPVSMWAGWHPGRRRAARPADAAKSLPRTSNLAAAPWDLQFCQVANDRERGRDGNELFHLHKLIPSGGSRHNLPPPELALLIL